MLIGALIRRRRLVTKFIHCSVLRDSWCELFSACATGFSGAKHQGVLRWLVLIEHPDLAMR